MSVRTSGLRRWVLAATAVASVVLGACGDGGVVDDVRAPLDATGSPDGVTPVDAGAAEVADAGGADVVAQDRGPIDPIVSDFSLLDVNPNSATRDTMISPQQYRPGVSAWYFATATCHECTVQFGYLDAMQRELDAMTTRRRIHLAGIADPISEGLTNLIATDRRIPLLQDTNTMNVKGSWGSELRDVVILDERALRVAVYNLTEHSLTDPANYAALRAMLLEVANR